MDPLADSRASETDSLLEKLDSIAPIQQFDAFPKLPHTYKSRTIGGGFVTVSVILLSILLVMNDLQEYIWGWADQEFSVDNKAAEFMTMNVDMVVHMPCHYLSVDLRDAVGERLHLSTQFRRHGTVFDVGQAQVLRNYQNQKIMDARDAVTLSRRSKGFFSWLTPSKKAEFPPTYNYRPEGGACRIYGSVDVKKVTGNLHITTLGHGYSSQEHTDHSIMNLSHVITEFSFGPYFPDIVQPLDGSFEPTDHEFSVFQYFLNVVPTTYRASSGREVSTNQYSVTHYVKQVQHGEGAPGVYFKFDVDPLVVDVYQRTTTFRQFLLRVVGVVGGVWVCAGWAFKIGGKAIEVAVGSKRDEDLLTEANSTSRAGRWTGGSLGKRKVTNEKTWEENMSPGWTLAPTTPFSPYSQPVSVQPANIRPASPYVATANGGSGSQLGNGAAPTFHPSPLLGPATLPDSRSSSLPSTARSPYTPSLQIIDAPSIAYPPGRVSPSPAHPSFQTYPAMSSLTPNRASSSRSVSPSLPVDGNAS